MAASKLRQRDRLEELTYQAFQTVRVWALTKSKKGRMPKFESLLPARDAGNQTAAQMKSTMQMLAQQYGQKRMRVSTRNLHGE